MMIRKGPGLVIPSLHDCEFNGQVVGSGGKLVKEVVLGFDKNHHLV